MLLAQVPSPPAPSPAAPSSSSSSAAVPASFRARGAAVFLHEGKAEKGIHLFTVECTGTACSLTTVNVNRCRDTSWGDGTVEAQWPTVKMATTRDGTLVVEALTREQGRFTMPVGNGRTVVEFVLDPKTRETRSMTVTIHDPYSTHRLEPLKPPLLPAACPFFVPGTAG
jgi:hypothetical protein